MVKPRKKCSVIGGCSGTTGCNKFTIEDWSRQMTWTYNQTQHVRQGVYDKVETIFWVYIGVAIVHAIAMVYAAYIILKCGGSAGWAGVRIAACAFIPFVSFLFIGAYHSNGRKCGEGILKPN